jgi:hypothetical protein
MRDLLLPTTDAGALTQLVAVGAVTALAATALRRHRELRTFVTGVGKFTRALLALRAVH